MENNHSTIRVTVCIYFPSTEQALHELPSLGDTYGTQGNSKGSVQGKCKWLSPLPLCQVSELKYTLRSICLTLYALATQAAVKSGTAGAHNPGAAQITPEAVPLAAA